MVVWYPTEQFCWAFVETIKYQHSAITLLAFCRKIESTLQFTAYANEIPSAYCVPSSKLINFHYRTLQGVRHASPPTALGLPRSTESSYGHSCNQSLVGRSRRRLLMVYIFQSDSSAEALDNTICE